MLLDTKMQQSSNFEICFNTTTMQTSAYDKIFPLVVCILLITLPCKHPLQISLNIVLLNYPHFSLVTDKKCKFVHFRIADSDCQYFIWVLKRYHHRKQILPTFLRCKAWTSEDMKRNTIIQPSKKIHYLQNINSFIKYSGLSTTLHYRQ